MKPDRLLQVRMGIVILLFGLLYAGLIGGIILIAESILVSAIITGLLVLGQYWYSKTIALKLTGAKKVSPSEYPELHNQVNNIARQASLKTPEIAIINTQIPNAFVTGRTENSAVLCVTKGLLNKLNSDEQDAVIAHELSHIINKDMVIMTMATVITAIFSMLARWGAFFADDDDIYSYVVFILANILLWIISFFLLRALSRYREYAADRGAAALTGNPLDLASALKKIDRSVSRTPKEDLREIESTESLQIIETGLNLISTHPPTEKRVERLKQYQKEKFD